MLRKLRFAKTDIGESAVSVWSAMVIIFFALIAIIVFPVMIIKSAPKTLDAEGVNGYVTLAGAEPGDIFKLRGEWEFYPNKLYTFDDFSSGRVKETRVVSFPHYWKHEPAEIIDRASYSTYRMRVRVPSSFDGIGIYSRYQNSAYEVFLNDIRICYAGVVDEDFSNHVPVLLPTNGYTFAAVGSEGRTFSVILHVQNTTSDSGGFVKDILIGPAESVKTLRTLLVLINGFISGGLTLLFICLFVIYLSGRARKEYLDYTIVALAALFISLTNGGESLMYSIGIDSVLLTRLEYCAFITGAFFANYSVIRGSIKSKKVFYAIHLYIAASVVFFLSAPILVATNPYLNMPIVVTTAAFFVLPLVNSLKRMFEKHAFDGIISFISYTVVVTGMCCYFFGIKPWDSIDVLSFSILIHCVMQLVIFLLRYRKTEEELKEMTETLEERIAERTIELTLMKEKAEAATLAKSNFLASMSHEIRTPMNAIMGISDLIRTDNLDGIQMDYITDIKKSSRALLQIINDILDFSKIEAGKLEIIPVHFNLMAVYDNICSICQFTADIKNLEFRTSIAPDVPQYVYGDEIRYRQIILNIVNNAVKYTKAGYVDFRVSKTEIDGIPFLEFAVKDTGIGIKSEDFDKLFDVFEQLDSAANRKIVGTGLGLSITKRLVTLMNGEIKLESEYGKGSAFYVYLPLAEGDKDKISVQEAYVPVVAEDARVLVVDDNEINLTVASGFLAIHGIRPDMALSGKEAIEKIKSNAYDLVFMDHMMPEMDGVEATRIIRSIENGCFAGLPIVALTANAVSGAAEIFKKAGMNDFITKPINAAHLNMVLARWLPDDKLREGMTSVQDDDLDDESSEIFDELSRIEGLNVADGLSHVANNKSTYLLILRQYCAEINRYIDGIKQDLAGCRWENYAINLHAMKGALANIGVAETAKWAQILEVASRNKDYQLCFAETEQFCEKMSLLRDDLIAAGLIKEIKPFEKTPIGAEELKELLAKLKSVCMMGDSTTADQIQQEIRNRSFDDETDAELDEICDLANSYDFELVAERINDILSRI